jgi:hypothetical protein
MSDTGRHIFAIENDRGYVELRFPTLEEVALWDSGDRSLNLNPNIWESE